MLAILLAFRYFSSGVTFWLRDLNVPDFRLSRRLNPVDNTVMLRSAIVAFGMLVLAAVSYWLVAMPFRGGYRATRVVARLVIRRTKVVDLRSSSWILVAV